jgi:peptidoglycan glycosyltransferase
VTRGAEAALIVFAALIAALGVTAVNFARSVGADAQVALTLVAFVGAFGSIHLAVREWAPAAIPYLIPLGAFISAVGYAEVYRVSGDLGTRQLWWLLAAAAAAVAVLYILRDRGVSVLRRYRYIFLASGLALLLLPLLPSGWPLRGAVVNGSRLWVRLDLPLGGTLSFQPGEVAKLAIVVFLASFLAERGAHLAAMTRRLGPVHMPEPRQLMPLALAFAAAFAVLVYQRDLGASLLLFTLFVTMLFAATGRHSYLAAGGLMVAGGGFAAWSAFGHVQTRVTAWLHPFDDYLGSGYQVAQGLFALGSGSLTGSGLGVGRPDLIPAAATDYVFAAVAEEMGLAGAFAVLAAFALLAAAGFGIALRSRDLFRKLLAGGLTLVLTIQTILIIAGVLRMLPVTGITLPFMSYGGSSLMANMVLLALLLRISHEERT